MTTDLQRSVSPQKTLYEQDYCLWLDTTAQLLRERQLDGLDLENLIAEIEAMGGSQRRELESRLRVLLMHLLKYRYQPSYRSNSWLCTINEQRSEIELLLKYSPSLKPYLSEVFPECYSKAQRNAAKETNLPLEVFPTESPFTQEETLSPDYLPN